MFIDNLAVSSHHMQQVLPGYAFMFGDLSAVLGSSPRQSQVCVSSQMKLWLASYLHHISPPSDEV